MTLNDAIYELNEGFTVQYPVIVIVQNGMEIFKGNLGELTTNHSNLLVSDVVDDKIPHRLANDGKTLLFEIK